MLNDLFCAPFSLPTASIHHAGGIEYRFIHSTHVDLAATRYDYLDVRYAYCI